jgi:hypothetical protein
MKAQRGQKEKDTEEVKNERRHLMENENERMWRNYRNG